MIRLLHGDCLAMLKEVEPGSVDLILCDPPYSSGGTHAGDRKASTTAKYTDNDFNGAARLPAFSGDNMDQRSFTAFMRWVCSELRQKTREGGDPGDVRGLAKPPRDDGRCADGRLGVEGRRCMGQGHQQKPAGTLPERLRVRGLVLQWRSAY